MDRACLDTRENVVDIENKVWKRKVI